MGRWGPSAPREGCRAAVPVREDGLPAILKIVVETGGEGVGWVGYWETTWHDQPVWETGWAVIPSFQGRGIASSATAQLIEKARAEQQHRYVLAFPMLENAPSNAICRKLGFTLLGEIDFPARRGGFVRCNDWRFDLLASSG